MKLQPVLGPFPISLRHHSISLLEHDIQRRELRYINGEHLFFLQFSPAPRLFSSTATQKIIRYHNQRIPLFNQDF